MRFPLHRTAPRILAAPLVALGLLAALPAGASAATTWSFDAAASKLTVRVPDPGGSARISRTAAGAIQVDGVTAGAATVRTTDTIAVTGATGPQRIAVDLSGGPLAPGRTPETGTGAVSEIELVVDAGTGGEGPPDELRFLGGPGADTVRAGVTGVRLNADDDADVIATGVEQIAAEGRGGDDRLGGEAAGLPLRLAGGDGTDELAGGRASDTLQGGPGADTLTGGPGDDTLEGAGGVDVLHGGEGVDVLRGQADADWLDGGPQADLFDGGDGTDTATYAGHAAPVTVRLDGLRNDGAAGEQDSVRRTVENVIGGAGADRLVGDDRANRMLGGPGDDVLDGGYGPDALDGGADRDRVEYGNRLTAVVVRLDALARDGTDADGDGVGEEGDLIDADTEVVRGGGGDDLLVGNGRDNQLDGGAGDDELRGGGGTDTLTDRSGRDRLFGGDHHDVFFADDGDGADFLDSGTGTAGGAWDDGDERVNW